MFIYSLKFISLRTSPPVTGSHSLVFLQHTFVSMGVILVLHRWAEPNSNEHVWSELVSSNAFSHSSHIIPWWHTLQSGDAHYNIINPAGLALWLWFWLLTELHDCKWALCSLLWGLLVWWVDVKRTLPKL